jgi:Ca-activated chloride channel family protein
LESVLVVSLLVSGLPGSAEDKQSPPVFKAGVDVVNITLTVRDKLGQLVSDLTADDFVVYEDGRPQQVALFARATEPGQEDALSLDLGLLLDTSESMAQQMKLTRESALRFLDAIPRARDLLVIFFDQDIRISRYDSENQQGLVGRIIDMKGSGNTALYDAISVYLSRVEESQGRKVLVLFTDGEDSRSITTLTELIALVRSSNVMVYAISFAGSSFSLGSNRYVSARTFLAYLAEMTGGDIYTPTSPRDLEGIYQKILSALAGQYVIGFVSDNLKRDGKFRKLRIELKDKGRGLKIQHRVGYVPATPK